MPFIDSKVSVKITEEQEKELKTRLGQAISLIPGKSENWLMTGFEDDYHLYFRGDNSEPVAYIEVRLFGGANRLITEDFIDEVIADFEEGDIILLQNEINLLDVIIEKAYEKGMQIVLNPSPFNESLTKCDLNKVSYFILNEIEGEQMTGVKEPEEILKDLIRRFPLAGIVLTLGKEGSVYLKGEDICRQSAYKVKAVDTTAAGDTFTGYFISAVINGMEPEEGLDLASKASAIAVTRQGALDSVPTIEEVHSFQGKEQLC